MKNQVQVTQTGNLKINLRRYYRVIPIILFFILILIFSFLLLTLKNNRPEQASNSNKEKQIKILPQDKTIEDLEGKEREGMLEYFTSYYLPQYPKFQAEVKSESIKRVFPITLKKISEGQGRGWLAEVEDGSEIISHYLLTPIIEKKLVDSMSCVSQNENPPIELEKVETVGNEGSLGRDLEEKSGYLILSGTKNDCYGGDGSGFVSVYNIRTGEKIKLQGDFINPGAIWKGVSKTGNALGILRGIYGVNEPTIVVEYGSFEGAATKIEEIGAVAYFDLQTGKLKQLVKFQ